MKVAWLSQMAYQKDNWAMAPTNIFQDEESYTLLLPQKSWNAIAW